MPLHTTRRGLRLNRMHILPRLHMRNHEPIIIATTASHAGDGAAAFTATNDVATIERKGDGTHGTCHPGEGVPAYEVAGVPEGEQGVGAADGEVAAAGIEGDGVAGGGVGVEGVYCGLEGMSAW